MPTFLPTVSLDERVDRPQTPPPITPANVARTNQENEQILRAQPWYQFYGPHRNGEGPAGGPRDPLGGLAVANLPERRLLLPPPDEAHIDAIDVDDDDDDAPQDHPLAAVMHYKELDRTGPKPKIVKKTTVKNGSVKIANITRMQFATALLALHQLQDVFEPRATGFPFKLRYTGMPGGAQAAVTIDTDAEFNLEVARIMNMKRKDIPSLTASFDTSDMDPWKVMKRGMPADFTTPPFGARPPPAIPTLETMAAEDQLYGRNIQAIKSANSCVKHPGEHGEPGACYITSSADHVKLTFPLLRKWAAAMDAVPGVDALTPPNTPEFDDARFENVTLRPRGRGGPGNRSGGEGLSELMAGMLAATTSMSTMFAANMARSLGPAGSAANLPAAPPAETVPKTPVHKQVLTQADYSPFPKRGDELRWFINDFIEHFRDEDDEIEQIDKVSLERKLKAAALTPRLLAAAPNERLEQLLGLPLGHILGLKSFGTEWANRLTIKRNAPSPQV